MSDTYLDQQNLIHIIGRFMDAQSILATVQLGIAEALKDGPKQCKEIAATTNTQAEPLYRLLRVLVGLGVLCEDPEQVFQLTSMGRCLLSNEPHSLRNIVLMFNELYKPCWTNLAYTLQTGKSAFEHTFGMRFLPYMEQNPGTNRLFDRAVGELSSMYDVAVAAAYDLSSYKRIADIGGGIGTFLAVLLHRYPEHTGILFEQPSVIEAAQNNLEQQGVSSRCTLVGGDFLESVPSGADVYIMKGVLSDWDDANALKILENCRKAITPQGRLLVIQRVLSVESSFSSEIINLHKMLMKTPNVRIRTEAELRVLFEGSGFQLNRIIPTSTEMSIIEAEPSPRATGDAEKTSASV